MVYKVIVDWYNDFTEKEETVGLFLVADTYGDVVNKVTTHFGEEDLSELRITPWAPDDFIQFDLGNVDEDWLFHKVDKDIGKNVIW